MILLEADHEIEVGPCPLLEGGKDVPDELPYGPKADRPPIAKQMKEFQDISRNSKEFEYIVSRESESGDNQHDLLKETIIKG